MNKEQIGIKVVYTFITAFVLSSLGLSGNNESFALLGFGLFGGGEEGQSTTATSHGSAYLQNARCYSPTGSIIDSCNSEDLSTSENTGYNPLGQ